MADGTPDPGPEAPILAIPAIRDYVTRRWPVFPCDTQKQPRTRNGFRDAHLDFDLHRDWWTQHPDDTVGIATGGRSRLLVIDLDSYKAGGHPEWDALAQMHGGLPETYTVRTGQGGLQHYLTIPDLHPGSGPEPIPCSVGKLPNVDVRADGGYIIAAPSVTIYGRYQVVSAAGVDPAPAPEWVIEFARKAHHNGVDVTSSEVVFRPDEHTPEELARLANYSETVVKAEVARLAECTRSATPGMVGYTGPAWDATVFEVACNLVELANSPWTEFSEADARTVLLGEAPHDATFGDAQIIAKWDSARKKIGDGARAVPQNPTGGGYFIPFEGGHGGVIDPAGFFVRGEGLNTSLLVQAVMDMGPLAIEDTAERSVWAYRRGVWRYAPNEVSDRVSVLLGGRFRPNHIGTVLPPLQQRLAAEGSVVTCEPNPALVNCTNGMLDWRSGTMTEHDPRAFSTVQIPVDWEPAASCPRFEAFVASIMAEDAVEYLWEVLGYMVYSGNPLQKAVLLHGAGANGKGTLIRVLTGILGGHNCSSVTLQDITEGKFEVASLFGKIANLAGDIDPTYMRSTAKFKAITGEDTIEAQRKFQHPFRFKCWATPLFSANEFWKSADTTTGYKRRWLLVPFPNTFEIQAGFSESFETEYPGILVKAVDALARLMRRGDFDPPASAVTEKDRFELAADQVAEWLIDDPAIVVSDPRNTAVSYGAAEAYRAYRRWAEDTGNPFVSAQKFRQRLETAGYQIRKSGVKLISGLRLDTHLTHIPGANALNLGTTDVSPDL